MALTLEPTLPIELIREVFEFAALSHPSCAPKLCTISHATREWIEPELYRILRVDSDVVRPPFIRDPFAEGNYPVVLLPQLTRISRHVRHALLQERTESEIEDVLTTCSAIKDLALWVVDRNPDTDADRLLSVLQDLTSLKSISLDPNIFIPKDGLLGSSGLRWTFQNVTHFHILLGDNLNAFTWNTWKSIASLPCLTHLSMDGERMRGVSSHVLKECSRLQMLILFYFTDLIMGTMRDRDNEMPDDPRLVLALYPNANMFIRWEREARGQKTYWMKAEEIRQQQREAGCLGKVYVGKPSLLW